MIPNKEEAVRELEIAGKMNPGKWVEHSLNVAKAAELIANNCDSLDSERAYIFGLLHDIGRREGVFAVKHIIDGYDFCISKGWNEIARICLTHSFPVKDFEKDIGKKDITEEQYKFIEKYLNTIEYDDYDKLIILCDALATADGLCILEKRFIDTTRRYGIYPFTIERWDKTYEYKEYFERKIGQSIYKILPNIEECIYN